MRKSRVFGVSLSKCVRHDAELSGRRAARVLPSSESSLLEALSLHSAGVTPRFTPRLSAEQLYDEHCCSTLLLVPRVVRVCCQHLKTHGNKTTGLHMRTDHKISHSCFIDAAILRKRSSRRTTLCLYFVSVDLIQTFRAGVSVHKVLACLVSHDSRKCAMLTALFDKFYVCCCY